MKKKKRLLIFGIGEQADVVSYYFKEDSDYEIVAYCTDKQYIHTESHNELPLIDFEDIESQFSTKDYLFHVAIGYSNMNTARQKIYEKAKSKGYQFASYISSKCIIAKNAEIGENNLILEMNNIQPFCRIGNNNILWSGNHIGHHAIIGNNCFITSHVVVSGGVTVNDNCFIGVNATIHDHIEIGKSCLIAAGSMINKNTDPDGVYIGSPAKKHRLSSKEINL